jgi:DNA-binding SARP family transcriptional activator
VHLRDLGVPALVIDGEQRHARIGKSYALCAYLIHVGGRATRDELLEALFDGRLDDSSRAYLRQANQVLRGLLPDGIELLREGDMFLLEGASAVETETMLLQARLVSATALVGTSRLEATHNIVREYGDAIFLEGVECRWVSTRRAEVAAMIADARIDTAILAFELSRFELAGAMLTTVLEHDPYREQGWRILMRVAAAQGLEDRVIETFRRCESALERVGLEPSPSTRLLAERLRR